MRFEILGLPIENESLSHSCWTCHIPLRVRGPETFAPWQCPRCLGGWTAGDTYYRGIYQAVKNLKKFDCSGFLNTTMKKLGSSFLQASNNGYNYKYDQHYKQYRDKHKNTPILGYPTC